MTPKEKLTAIENKIKEAVPEILELKFGCKVRNLWASESNPDRDYLLTGIDVSTGISIESSLTIKRGMTPLDDGSPSFEILGRDITLEDCLFAIGKTERMVAIDVTGEFIEAGGLYGGHNRCDVYWSFGKPLHLQDPSVWEFLYSILIGE